MRSRPAVTRTDVTRTGRVHRHHQARRGEEKEQRVGWDGRLCVRAAEGKRGKGLGGRGERV